MGEAVGRERVLNCTPKRGRAPMAKPETRGQKIVKSRHRLMKEAVQREKVRMAMRFELARVDSKEQKPRFRRSDEC